MDGIPGIHFYADVLRTVIEHAADQLTKKTDRSPASTGLNGLVTSLGHSEHGYAAHISGV